jgi:LysR family transcriptional activator of nhaA
MRRLNYQHLLYFWTVPREGSISHACARLHLTEPTVSGQLRTLARSLGVKLFERVGRRLELTEAGREVYQYADEIFALGHELEDRLNGRANGKTPRLLVGIADTLPKVIAYRILEPALHLPEAVQLICEQGKPEFLLAQLGLHALDLVLADAPIGAGMNLRAFNHLLGECDVSLLATPDLADHYQPGFPQSLDGAPFLLPAANTLLRRSLDRWFETAGIRPRVRGEFADSALLKVFGENGVGIFAVRTAVEAETQDLYKVRSLGRVDAIRERFYAISLERKITHPAVAAITAAAREKLFA